MPENNKRIAASLVAGLTLTLIGYFCWRHYFKIDENTVRVSKVLKVEPRELKTVFDIQDKFIRGEAFTDADWQRLLPLIKGSNAEMSGNALGVLGSLENTKFRQQAVDVARGYLTGPNDLQRSTSLSILWRMGAQDWKQAAAQLKSDPSVEVRKHAENLLAMGEHVRKQNPTNGKNL
jgi:hypothetical protein